MISAFISYIQIIYSYMSVFPSICCVTELVLQWSTENDLRLNVDNTKAIVIGPYYHINKLSQHYIEGITLNGSLIKFESSVKSLGGIIDCKLNWKQQVSAICKRGNFLMYRLKFFRKCTTFRLQKHPIVSLLFPCWTTVH